MRLRAKVKLNDKTTFIGSPVPFVHRQSLEYTQEAGGIILTLQTRTLKPGEVKSLAQC